MTTPVSCKSCNTQFGFRRKPRLYLHHRKSKFIVEGNYKVTAICRNCSSLNEITSQDGQTRGRDQVRQERISQ